MLKQLFICANPSCQREFFLFPSQGDMNKPHFCCFKCVFFLSIEERFRKKVIKTDSYMASTNMDTTPKY